MRTSVKLYEGWRKAGSNLDTALAYHVPNSTEYTLLGTSEGSPASTSHSSLAFHHQSLVPEDEINIILEGYTLMLNLTYLSCDLLGPITCFAIRNPSPRMVAKVEAMTSGRFKVSLAVLGCGALSMCLKVCVKASWDEGMMVR